MQDIFELIKRSYTFLQLNLFLEYYIKVDDGQNGSILKVLDATDYTYNFDQNAYYLRKDYIRYGLDTSMIDGKELNMGILSEMAIFNSFSSITSSFYELLNYEEPFRDFVENLFQIKWYHYESFKSILSLIRNITIHWSLANTYILKEKDFSIWKAYHVKKWIEKLELNLNIVEGLHRLDIIIIISDIDVWFRFSEVFDGYKMLMLIELCMNLIQLYEKENY